MEVKRHLESAEDLEDFCAEHIAVGGNDDGLFSSHSAKLST